MFPTNEVQQKGAKAICNTFRRYSSCQKEWRGYYLAQNKQKQNIEKYLMATINTECEIPFEEAQLIIKSQLSTALRDND